MNEIHELTSNQEETDTRVVLYLKYAIQMGYQSAVVRSPDTDILCILLHYALSLDITIYLDIGTGKNRKIVNVSELAESRGARYCTALLSLYVFTGEDATSAFKGKGKVGPLKKLQNHQKYQISFRFDHAFISSSLIKCLFKIVFELEEQNCYSIAFFPQNYWVMNGQ